MPFSRGALERVITLSEATRQYLVVRGAPPSLSGLYHQALIRTGCICRLGMMNCATRVASLVSVKYDFVVTYFGSPAPVRGLFTLIRAIEKAALVQSRLKMLVLSRRKPNRWVREANRLDKVASSNGNEHRIRIVDGFIDLPDLIRHIAVSDAVCLPFELLPSDAPLSILEAMAIGQTVVTTNLAGRFGTVVEDGRGFMVEPGSMESLAACLQEIVVDPHITREYRQLRPRVR